MKSVELKTDLHKLVDKVSDSKILKAVHTILSSHISAKNSELLDLLLEESEVDIEKGEIVSHKDFKKEVKTWRK